jgi:hypothetical protein
MDKAKEEFAKYQNKTLTQVEKDYLNTIKRLEKKLKSEK